MTLSSNQYGTDGANEEEQGVQKKFTNTNCYQHEFNSCLYNLTAHANNTATKWYFLSGQLNSTDKRQHDVLVVMRKITSFALIPCLRDEGSYFWNTTTRWRRRTAGWVRNRREEVYVIYSAKRLKRGRVWGGGILYRCTLFNTLMVVELARKLRAVTTHFCSFAGNKDESVRNTVSGSIYVFARLCSWCSGLSVTVRHDCTVYSICIETRPMLEMWWTSDKTKTTEVISEGWSKREEGGCGLVEYGTRRYEQIKS